MAVVTAGAAVAQRSRVANRQGRTLAVAPSRLDAAAQFAKLDGHVRDWIDGVKRVEDLQDRVWRKVDSVDYALVKLRDELIDILPAAFEDMRPAAARVRPAPGAFRRADPRRDRRGAPASGRAGQRDAFAAA